MPNPVPSDMTGLALSPRTGNRPKGSVYPSEAATFISPMDEGEVQVVADDTTKPLFMRATARLALRAFSEAQTTRAGFDILAWFAERLEGKATQKVETKHTEDRTPMAVQGDLMKLLTSNPALARAFRPPLVDSMIEEAEVVKQVSNEAGMDAKVDAEDTKIDTKHCQHLT